MSLRTASKIRLYVDEEIKLGVRFCLNVDDSHYLCNVMRLREGVEIGCFNEKVGEFGCKIMQANKKKTELEAFELRFEPVLSPDVWLLFAPLKKDNTDFVIQKSTELGVRKICPVLTKNTITDKIKIERMQLQAKEASEQCERTDVPKVEVLSPLEKVLQTWDKDRILYFMDETLDGDDCASVFAQNIAKASAILVGPEGGFSKEERAALKACSFVRAISMGKRILRAETACCAALAVWQAVAGDWKGI